MESKCGVTCVIPFCNEGERILSVLDILTRIPSLDGVVCVDNGSDDDSLSRIRQRWPRMPVLKLPEHQEKTIALKQALNSVTTPYVLLMQPDSQNIDEGELEKILQTLHQCPDIDMVILRRQQKDWFGKMNRADVLFAAERILRTDDLRQILNESVAEVQLEAAINAYMSGQNKQVHWVPWPATSVEETEQPGSKGVRQDLMRYARILQYVGLVNFYRHLTHFALKSLPVPGRGRY